MLKKYQFIILIFSLLLLPLGQVNAADTTILNSSTSKEEITNDPNAPSPQLSDTTNIVYLPFIQTDSTKMNLTIIQSDGYEIIVEPTGPYTVGEQVTATAIVSPGYIFTGWDGDINGETNPMIITMDSNKTIGATTEISTASVFYVSQTGSDSNPGTLDRPFKSIQYAINLANNPGDLILVMPGEYHSTSTQSNDSFRIENKNGLPNQEIIIRAYDPTQKPVIVNRSAGFRIVNSSYVIIDGFEFKDFINTGIAIYLSNNVIIKNNYMHLSFEGLCKSGEGLPKCKSDGSGTGQIKGRIDNLGNYILEHDGSQNTGIYMCKSQNNLLYGNRIEHVDEGIYIGTAGQINTNSCGTGYPPRTWATGNVVENNIIFEAMNEGIELKPDAIRTIVKDNLLKNSAGLEIVAIDIRSAYNDVSGNVIFGDNQFSKTGIRTVDETLCTNPPNDEFGNSMLLYPKSTGYICSFRNIIHHNYIYYSQGDNYLPAINNHIKSAANTIDHNTIVGGNDFGIISDAISSSITNNLIIGYRGTKASFITQTTTYKPATSDYNAYYPNKKITGSCTIAIAGVTIFCESGQNSIFEVHSIFMPSNPIGSFQPATSPLKIDGECAPSYLSTLSLEELKETIISCSKPLDNAYGNLIVNKASDNTNIGASQQP
ncbi:MAG: right-handed parallel beta-helix repeat-containing protein [Anaerolineaceae bacterium]|nr:right-handed parallel beta-helix repeat-containing protein [Anaerolineaceae bacterium]